MSSPFMEEPPEDFDPWAVASHTNFGATSMLQQIAANSRAAQKRQRTVAGMLGAINRMNNPSMTSGIPNARFSPSGHGPGGKHHPGNFKAPRNKKLAALMHVIGGQESNQNYSAVNADSGALGRWQVMPGNLQGPGGWDKQALGRNISPHQFLTHPKLQNKIVKKVMRGYLRNYGLRGTAQAWYGGPGAVGNNNIPGGAGYPTTGQYADSVMGMIRRYLRRHR